MDCYRLLHTLEAWVTGYRSEHYKLGLQQAICFALALLPIVVNKLYLTLDRGGSSLYTAITVSACASWQLACLEASECSSSTWVCEPLCASSRAG